MPDVFISYARADRKQVRLIAMALAKEGFGVWWDPKIKPGKKWNDAIRKALQRSDCVVTCWSPTSIKSDWVAAESHHGYASQSLVPIMLRACVPPLPFNVIQASDLSQWKGDPDDPEWVAALERVRDAIEKKRRPPSAAPTVEEAQAAARLAAAGAVTGATTASTADATPQYRLSRTRGRMAPRASRWVLAAVVVGVVITGGLWAADRYAPGFVRSVADRYLPGGETASVEPPITPGAFQEASLPQLPQATDTAVLEDLPPAQEPADFTPPQSAPPTTAPTAPTGTDYAGQLDSCARRLAFACPAAAGRAPLGFRQNGRMEPAERRFLATLGVPLDPVGAQSTRACSAALGASSPTAAYRSACGTLIYTTTPGAPAPVTPPQSTTDAAPQTPPPSDQTADTQDNNNRTPWGAILGAGAAIGAAILMNQGNNNNNNDDQSTPQRSPNDPGPIGYAPQPGVTRVSAPAARSALPALPGVQLSLQSVEAQLDQCLNRLARYCPQRPSGFASDGRLSSSERALLSSASLFQPAGEVSRTNYSTCQAHLSAASRPASSGAARAYLPLATACGA
ncbi:MAG: TIR domain-containing protein [Alphaproteobacteria bacterium]|nr:TIR domain-containing protein [Alphaproteobacteria bacterium]